MGSPHYAVETQKESATAYSISKAGLNMAVAKYAVSPSNRDAGLTIVAITPGFMKSKPANSPSSKRFNLRVRIVKLTVTSLAK